MDDTDQITRFLVQQQPSRAAVIGGGFIGIEMAENLIAAGLNVHIIEMSDQVVAPLDKDMACDVHHYLRQKGVSLHFRDRVKRISEQDSHITLELSNGFLETDMVILAIGIKPESQIAKEAGLDIGSRGGIMTDKHMRTSDPDIFAVGDAVEVTDFVTKQAVMVPLAGPANKQARIAADNICGIPSEYEGTQGSAVMKVFDMTVAVTGVNEKSAVRLGLDYDKIFLWLPSHASYYPDANPLSMKIIFHKKSRRILGAQLVGSDGADKRCDVLAAAIRAGMTADDLTQLELCYAPPYSSVKDPVNVAGYVIGNVIEERIKQYHWHDVDKLPRDGSITLLDVRTPEETAQGHIDGSMNIPLNVLREHLRDIDRSKPVFLYCHSGMRSYAGARILMQNGYDAVHLCGGYRLYNAVMRDT
jgi:pyruvate/2-oxoglutarate dehydrogenase complex dihydrolipoamide dehydrogenase (E3) component/rhodanese-related sulfurtransferase